MNREIVINKLQEIIESDYDGMYSLCELYRKLKIYEEYISSNVSPELYEKFTVELDTVNNEYKYGDNDIYTYLCYNDCIGVLEQIICEVM
jgi:hypothetical protein